MLIVTQDRKRVINLNNAIDLFVDKQGKPGDITWGVAAYLGYDEVTLGRYPSEDAAESALMDIIEAYNLEDRVHFMPQGIEYDGQDREPEGNEEQRDDRA